MMRLRIWAILCSVMVTGLLAQDNRAKFERFSIEDGLTHSTVRQVIQDRQGFLWFITPDGANRYDGYHFYNYRHDPYDSTSLTANSQNTIFVDSRGTVWIGNFDGLCRYRPATDDFLRYQHHPGDSSSMTASYTSSICEDRQGDLWVATGAILHRFDHESQTFEAFPPISGDPFRIPIGLIQDMIPDPRPGSNGLFLASTSRGLIRFDIEKETFIQFFPVGQRFYPFMTQYSDSLLNVIDLLAEPASSLAEIVPEDHSSLSTEHFSLMKRQSILIICGGEGDPRRMFDYGWLSKGESGKTVWEMSAGSNRHMGGHFKNRLQMEVLDLPAGDYTLHYQNDDSHSPGDWNALPPKHQQWWGIHAYPLEKASSLSGQLSTSLHRPSFIPGINITSLFYDSLSVTQNQNVIWLGTGGNGAAKLELPVHTFGNQSKNPYYDLENSQFTVFTKQSEQKQGLSSNYIADIFADRAGDIWMATANGLNRLEPRKGKYSHYSHDPANIASLSSNNINSVFEDHSQNLWIATDRGVNKLNRQKHRFLHHTGSRQQSSLSQLPGSSISALYQDSRHNIWIATYGGCITRMDPVTGYYQHFPAEEETGHPLRYMTIRTITQRLEDPENILWFGTIGHGLVRFDANSGAVTTYTEGDGSSGISANTISRLMTDRHNRLWLGYESAGIDIFDPQSSKVISSYRSANLELEPQLSSSHLGSSSVWALLQDQRSDSLVVWVGTVGAGLCRLNADNGQFRHYPTKLNAPYAVNSKTITELFQDDAGILWIGTYSGGINRLDPQTGLFEHFSVRDGLSNNMITAIQQDANQHLWISTSSGLNRLNPSSATNKVFGVNDGLQSNQFNLWASLKDHNGRLYFGGIEGFNSFHPDSLQDNRSLPAVMVTDFRIFDRSVLGHSEFSSQSIYDAKSINLDYHQNFFAFEFVTLDYKNPQKNQHAYMLEGFDPDWIYCGQRRYASYTNLDPGDYVFRVKGANSDGIWNNTGQSITVVIAPPFWRTWWFSLIALLFLGGLAWSFHNYRLRARIARMRDIERVRKKAAADFHDELGHKLTKISLFSELAGRQLNGHLPETGDYIKRIHHISGSLYHNMRDFLWTLDPAKDTLFEVAIKLKDFGDEFFDNTGIHFRAEGIDQQLEGLTLSMDWKRHLVLIFKEAMNNILRHAECTNVLLTIERRQQTILITLSDDGKGIALPVAVGSHGIGNMRDRAERLGARLEINTGKDGRGTTIRFEGEIQ